MTEKEVEAEVRRWLDYTVAKGAYDAGAMLALKQLYYRGRSDVQEEIKSALNIQECYLNH